MRSEESWAGHLTDYIIPGWSLVRDREELPAYMLLHIVLGPVPSQSDKSGRGAILQSPQGGIQWPIVKNCWRN